MNVGESIKKASHWALIGDEAVGGGRNYITNRGSETCQEVKERLPRSMSQTVTGRHITERTSRSLGMSQTFEGTRSGQEEFLLAVLPKG